MDDKKVIVVFTRKSVETIQEKGGTASWKLRSYRAKKCSFVVCTRNANHKDAEGSETHHAAFLVGKVKDLVPSTTKPGRYMIHLSEFARVNIQDVWRKGDRNPVRYTTLKELNIDPTKLKWEPMPGPSVSERSEQKTRKLDLTEGLTIVEAKNGLARTFGVAPEAIEITVRG